MASDNNDRNDDYNFARQAYYTLIENALQALPALTELAKDAEHPKGYETLSQFVKHIADANDKFVNLQRKHQIMEKDQVESPNTVITTDQTQDLTFDSESSDLLATLEKLERNKEEKTYVDVEEGEDGTAFEAGLDS